MWCFWFSIRSASPVDLLKYLDSQMTYHNKITIKYDNIGVQITIKIYFKFRDKPVYDNMGRDLTISPIWIIDVLVKTRPNSSQDLLERLVDPCKTCRTNNHQCIITIRRARINNLIHIWRVIKQYTCSSPLIAIPNRLWCHL